MRWILLCCMAFCLIGCTAEKVEETTNKSEDTVSENNEELQQAISKQVQLGDLAVSVNHYMNVQVQQEGFEHIPRATQLTIVNHSSNEQDLSFLQDYQWVASKGETQSNLMRAMPEREIPKRIAGNEAVTFYIIDFSPQFDYSHMQLLKLERNDEVVYLPLPVYLGDISEQQLADVTTATIHNSTIEQNDIPTYEVEMLLRYDCPTIPLEQYECKGDANHHVISFMYNDKPVEMYVNGTLRYVKIEMNQAMYTFYFEDDELIQVTKNDKVIKVYEWLVVCAMQLKQLSETIEQLQLVEQDVNTVTSNESRITDVREIEDYIKNVIRPAYEKSEAAINTSSVKAEREGQIDIYRLQNLRKEIHETNEATYSAFFIDNQLAFILKIEQQNVLTRYYFKDDKLIRIIHTDKTKEHYATSANIENYVELERRLLNIAY